MDEVEKYKRFRICCCKPLKDKYRLMKTGRLTVVGEAVVTATQLSIAGERSLCHMCYLTVLIVQKRLRMSTPGHASNRCELIVTAARPSLPALSALAIRWDGLASQTNPGPTATWSAMLAPFKCSVNSCPCENTHGTPSAYCMCRIGLCARDYARVMVGMVLT